VVSRRGVATVLDLGPELDPSAWLELAPRLVTAEPLGAAAERPPAPQPPTLTDLRQVLAVPAGAGTARLAGSGLAAALRLLGLLGRSLTGLLTGHGAAAGQQAAGDQHLAPAGHAPVRPVPGGLRRAVNRTWSRLLLLTRLVRLAGLWQGAYVGRFVQMFERGDFEEALRHALPLGRPDEEPGALGLGLPTPRTGLEITATARGAGTSYAVGERAYTGLREIYRRAFEQLAAQGKVDQAAFVLAELLKAGEEAVSFLERHGRLRQAAELAEARQLPPGLVVRQWFLAGDAERAVRLARRTRSFADAVDRLERSQGVEPAMALRLLWAEDQAEAGDLEGAVATAWKVAPARALVARWIELAVLAGGEAGLALLPRRLELEPSRFEEVLAITREACSDRSLQGPSRRAALARGLLAVGATAAVRTLARPVLRAQLADRSRGGSLLKISGLRSLAADTALEADLPKERAAGRAPGPLSVTIPRDHRGARAALDAAILPDGRVLVALGEGGATLLTRDGREVARFDVPAHRLVVSELGTRALALGLRGEAVKVSRLDLDARKATPLRDLRLRTWSPAYDGARWAVATGREVLLLDTLRDDLRTLWSVPALPGVPGSLATHGDALTFVTAGADGMGGWRYDAEVLRSRPDLPVLFGREEAQLLAVGAHAGNGWHAVAGREGGEGYELLEKTSRNKLTSHHLERMTDLLGLVGGASVTVAVRTEEGAEVLVYALGEPRQRVDVSLPGNLEVAVRSADARLTLADGHGRVIGIDVDAGRVTHDLRI
jgi:hypothetical protein